MAHEGAALSHHGIATEITEFGSGVLLFKGSHETRGMKVAAGLTCNQIVFH